MNSDWFSGAVNTLAGVTDAAKQIANPRYALLKEQMLKQTQIDEKKLDAFLKSQRILDNLRQAQIDSIKRGGRFGTTPWYLSPDWINTPEGEAAREKALKGMSDIDQLKMWRGIQSSAEGQYFYPGGLEGGAKEPKNKELYDLATKNINEIMKKMKGRNIQEYFGPGTTENVVPSGVEGQETTGQDNGELFAPMGQAPAATERGQAPMGRGQVTGDIRDYFGPPKTFDQLGITDIDDMSTLQEMQNALPDIDMREEYEANPENMKELMELWRQDKLNKSNIHKAFSKIQQSAKQVLGIA